MHIRLCDVWHQCHTAKRPSCIERDSTACRQAMLSHIIIKRAHKFRQNLYTSSLQQPCVSQRCSLVAVLPSVDGQSLCFAVCGLSASESRRCACGISVNCGVSLQQDRAERVQLVSGPVRKNSPQRVSCVTVDYGHTGPCSCPAVQV